MGKADEMTEALTPLAREGNPEAVRALLRMMTADDADLEAEMIVEETAAIINVMFDILRPIIDMDRFPSGE